MGDLISLFGIVLGIIGLESGLDVRPVTISRITISEAIGGHWGYTPESIEQKLKDEAYMVMRRARSFKHGTRISTPNADGSIDKIARDAGVLRLLQRVQQSVGLLEYTITGDIVAEHGKALMELRARRSDQQVVRARFERPMDQLDELMRDAGWVLVRLVDPQVACAELLRRSLMEGRPDPAETLHCADEALLMATDSDLPWLLNLRGVALVMLDRDTEAGRVFRDVLSIKPDFAPAWLNIGTVFAVEGRHADAIEAFSTAIRYARQAEFAQTRSAAFVMWAISLEKLGRTDEAVPKLRHAFRADRTYDLPLRLLKQRIPPDSPEAEEIDRIITELSVPSGHPDWDPIYTENIVGVMPIVIVGSTTTRTGR
ncbi:tetratricopeptide repeat protein [Thalassobaculum sp.]|uniref:tetratricopeptide repeat protein n=1 Tax=Thalassobaculum sp. TaxID=2022740 RepID=UPI0032EEB70F